MDNMRALKLLWWLSVAAWFVAVIAHDEPAKQMVAICGAIFAVGMMIIEEIRNP